MSDKNNATIVHAKLHGGSYDPYWDDDPGEAIVSTHATSLRHPQDRFDPTVGYNLALGRALENLGRKIQKKANGKIRHNEEVKLKKNSNTNKKKVMIHA